MSVFIGTRLTILRNLEAVSREEIARDLLMTAEHLRLLERGTRGASVELVDALAEYFDVPPTFFEQGVETQVSLESCSFRSQRAASKRFRAAFAARASLLDELLAYLGRSGVQTPRPTLPPAEQIFPEEAAVETREALGVGQNRPILDLTLAVESAGVVVADVAAEKTSIDAMSCWIRDRPIVIRSLAKGSSSRARFDLAHELGHLVMHRALDATADREREADRFAIALLIPRPALVDEFPTADRWSWPTLFELKSRWGVSLAALVRAARDASVIDAVRYRSANVYMSSRGWRRIEPAEPTTEEPSMIRTVLSGLTERGLTTSGALREMRWSPTLFTKVTGVSPPPELRVVT